jgi:nicotinamidase-related amidase
MGNRMSLIPERHAQWKALDLTQLLALPTAFIPIGQANSLLSPNGAQKDERLWDRCRRKGGVLDNTLQLANASREAGYRLVWFRYEIFRKRYPATPMDEAQYRHWEETKPPLTEAQKEWDAELIDEVQRLIKPEDVDMLYTSLTNIFISTPLQQHLSMWGVKTVLLCGYHLDWCVESAARTARDLGFMPIVIGDASACGREEDEASTLDRINRFFAPVVSTAELLKHIDRARAKK